MNSVLKYTCGKLQTAQNIRSHSQKIALVQIIHDKQDFQEDIRQFIMAASLSFRLRFLRRMIIISKSSMVALTERIIDICLMTFEVVRFKQLNIVVITNQNMSRFSVINQMLKKKDLFFGKFMIISIFYFYYILSGSTGEHEIPLHVSF
ncbi:Hypothetical_protein [Hexamita inflata]|uniref:Hypothetical_protein n=1 Tax=Hexamita inflata TaxID=28002 RepID=A0AA86QIC8_9EUKA|nr:Hypothetical protein HINF_LOCUS42818 [Hexamita inflata]